MAGQKLIEGQLEPVDKQTAIDCAREACDLQAALRIVESAAMPLDSDDGFYIENIVFEI